MTDIDKNTKEQKSSSAISMKEDSLMAMAIIVCCIVSLIVYAGFHTKKDSQEVTTDINPFSPEYKENMSYLLNASIEAPTDFSKIKGGLLGVHIPIFDEKYFPWLRKKIEKGIPRGKHLR